MICMHFRLPEFSILRSALNIRGFPMRVSGSRRSASVRDARQKQQNYNSGSLQWQASPINRKSLTLPRSFSEEQQPGHFSPRAAKTQFQLVFLSGSPGGEIKKAGRRHLWSLSSVVVGQIKFLVRLPMRSRFTAAHFNDRNEIRGLMKKFMCIAHSHC